MQSHKVSGGNAKSPDASNTRQLMQSTPAQENVIDPHGRRGLLREKIAVHLEGQGLPAALATGNNRRLLVCAQDLHSWIASPPPPAQCPAGAVDPQHNRPVQTDWLDPLSGITQPPVATSNWPYLLYARRQWPLAAAAFPTTVGEVPSPAAFLFALPM